MLKYILKRILIFIPTLLVISLITFAISTFAPGDPVEQMLVGNNNQGQAANLIAGEKAYLELRSRLGLDLPIFYFGISNQAKSDTLHYIAKRSHRDNLKRIVGEYGNWPEIQSYYRKVRKLQFETVSVKKDSLNAAALIQLKKDVQSLYLTYDDTKITSLISRLLDKAAVAPSLGSVLNAARELKSDYSNVKTQKTTWKKWIPAIHWYGRSNQYHRWFFGDKPWFKDAPKETWTSAGFIRGDFGISYQDQRPVNDVIWDAIWWTMLISFLSIVLTYIIAIPLGVLSATKKGSVADQASTTTLFLLYSLPNFWIATLAIIFLCGGDYLNWFPPKGVMSNLPEDASFWTKFKDVAYHLILPLICWTYSGLAYLSRQMRGGMVSVLGQDYIRTARAKGLSRNSVVWKHAMRNSLLPVITLFASIFPLMISGGIVLEIIFSIPGMGRTAYEAIIARNYPIVYTIMMFSAILTLIGYLVADILYAVVDPRISYK